MLFCGCASNGQDSPKASPRVIFNWKNFIEQLKLILKWRLIETGEGPICWVQCANMCAEKCSRCGTVMIHDTSMFFCGCASSGQDSPKASPRVIFNWKNFIEQLKLILKWILIERWRRASMLSSMCQHVRRLQFDSCAEKHWNSHDSWWPELKMFGSMPFPWQKLHPRLAQENCGLYKFGRWVNILVFTEANFGMSVRKGIPQKHAIVGISFSFVGQATAKIRPRVIFNWKNLIEQLKLLLEWMLIERWRRYAGFNVPTCEKIAVCQLCRERQRLWNSRDSWWPEPKKFWSMPWCSFSWQKLHPRLAQENCGLYEFGRWVNILVFTEANFGMSVRKGIPQKHAIVGISFSFVGQATAKIRPRVIFNWKNLKEQLQLLLQWTLIEMWRRPSMLSSMRQHVATLQFDSCAEKDSLCGTVIMGLKWKCLDQCHGGVPMAEAPTWAGANDLSYDTLNLIHRITIVCIDTSVFKTSLRPAQG